jgi:hypothetical protein
MPGQRHVVGREEKSINIMEIIQGVKLRDAIAHHTQTIYTSRTRGGIVRHENCSTNKVDGNRIVKSFNFLIGKSYVRKKQYSTDLGLTPLLDIN